MGGKTPCILFSFHCDQWPNWKEKPGAIFGFLALAEHSFWSAPAAPISPVFLNHYRPAPRQKKGGTSTFSWSYLIVPSGSEIFEVPSVPGGTTNSITSRPCCTWALTSWDECPNITPGKTLPVSKAVVESPSLQGFNWCVDVAPGDMVNDGLASAGLLTTLS